VGLCRVSQMGVLRILTNRKWLKDEARSAEEVWSAWTTLLADDRFRVLEEPLGLEQEWRRRTLRLAPGSMIETDTYLAAFAVAAGLTLLTFDRGFQRFPGLAVEIPD
jgi:predicted nucleic acid-binding protein